MFDGGWRQHGAFLVRALAVLVLVGAAGAAILAGLWDLVALYH